MWEKTRTTTDSLHLDCVEAIIPGKSEAPCFVSGWSSWQVLVKEKHKWELARIFRLIQYGPVNHLLYDSISRVWPSGQRNKEQSKKSHSRVNQSILYKIQYNNIVINIISARRVS